LQTTNYKLYKISKPINVNFKVGDRVSFLNEKGGGIISKILGGDVIQVAIEDGFEIPVLISNLIKQENSPSSDKIGKLASDRESAVMADNTDDGISTLHLSHNNPDQRLAGIYFAMVPDIPETPIVGSLDLFVVNHTEYHVLFSIFENISGSFKGVEYGFLEPESKIHIGKIGRSELQDWANALLQCVFYRPGKTAPLSPFSGLIDFKPIKLYKEESFIYESLLRNKGVLVQVCKLSEHSQKPLFEETITSEKIKALQERIFINQGKSEPPKTKFSILEKHKIDDTIAEVDLHIGELLDNTNNLGKGDLLKVQLDYFDKCMNEAVKERICKIIFIHGVGNGKLKTEIWSRLQNIKGLEYYDASYARYGMGATEVNFLRNK